MYTVRTQHTTQLDALAKTRGAFSSNDEREQTLNQLLTEMDGFDASENNVLVIAATNRPEILDPALIRPGRFDRHVVVDLPDTRGRRAILAVHARSIRLAGDVDLHRLAMRTKNYSGAELANVTNEAALLAVRAEATAVSMHFFELAVERNNHARALSSGATSSLLAALQAGVSGSNNNNENHHPYHTP
jgi:cell division protease FtsH